MKILIHGINFYPELTGIGKYTGEMAVYLAEHDCDVKVVTARPYYPEWRTHPGYAGWGYCKERWQNILIYRCPIYVPATPSGLKRLLHLATFALSSAPVTLSLARWRPDCVIAIAPAISGAPVASLTARLVDCPSWLHVQDFEFDAAINLKMLPGAAIYSKILFWVEQQWLIAFDRVSTVSKPMQTLLHSKGIQAHKTYLFPNWVDEERIFPQNSPNPFRDEWDIPQKVQVVLYAGNIGQKQGLEVLLESAQRLTNEPILFILVGEGSARADLQSQASGLRNVRFYSLQPVERLNDLLNLADLHVLPQRADAADLVMPSKLGGMLASGKPVVATAQVNTALFEVIQQVGVVVPPGEPGKLAEVIRMLASNPEHRMQLGIQGRKYILEHWSKQKVLGNFYQSLQTIIESQHGKSKN